MAGLGRGRAAREHEVSAKELEVARLLAMLPRLVWEADHGPPCTHNLRWGAKKRRSVCADDDDDAAAAAAAPPPPPRPAAPANQSKKRTREAAAPPPKEPLRKEARREARQGLASAAAVKHPDESGAVVAAAAAAMGTSSPETPLDFCPSAEEADATAKALACPPDPARPPAKKPRLKHEYLSKQVDQLNSTRTELQKEAVEIRKRLEALRARNSELLELRIKMEEERKQQRPPRDCVDLLPAGPGRPAPAPRGPGRVHPQAQPPPPPLQQQQQYQQSWPQHWANNRVMFHQVAPGFSLHAPPAAAAAAESQGWSWAGAQTGTADGGGGGSRPGKVLDLLSGAGLDLALESQQQQQQQQQQQNNYYYQQQQEQKAARKKRIQMMQQRRNAAAAAGGAGVKVASFR